MLSQQKDYLWLWVDFQWLLMTVLTLFIQATDIFALNFFSLTKPILFMDIFFPEHFYTPLRRNSKFSANAMSFLWKVPVEKIL